MTTAEPRIALIDNSVDPGLYRPAEHWAPHVGPFDVFVARDGRLPALGAGYTHLLLTGSEASILEREPWAEREAGLVRDAVARGLVVLGSCWGHQLIAYALAGPAAVGRAARPELGWIGVDVAPGGGPLGPAGRFDTFAVHYDEVRPARPEIEVAASTPDCPVHGFRWAGRPVWGIQAHPEIGPAEGERFLRALAAAGRLAEDRLAAILASGIRDSGRIRAVAAAFRAARPSLPQN